MSDDRETVAAVQPDAVAERGEGCPTPLDWREVLTAFRTERDEFVLNTSWGDVQLWEFGDGPPLVFLGGASGDADLFALTVWLLREERRCLLVTLPDLPKEIRSSEWLPGAAELVEHVVAARHRGEYPIFATGTGSSLALQAALNSPERVSHLILQGCRPDFRLTIRERLLFAVGRRWDVPLARVPTCLAVLESNHRRWFPPFDSSRWEFLLENLSSTPTWRFSQRMTAVGNADLSDRLSEIDCPALIVRSEGEGEQATRSQEALANQLPNARVEWMHSTGQFPHVTHPHRLVKLIREFLGETAAGITAQSPAPSPETPIRR